MTALICLLIVAVASLVARCSHSLATMTPSVAAALMVTATTTNERGEGGQGEGNRITRELTAAEVRRLREIEEVSVPLSVFSTR